jgi:tape measure domain-containing protein
MPKDGVEKFAASMDKVSDKADRLKAALDLQPVVSRSIESTKELSAALQKAPAAFHKSITSAEKRLANLKAPNLKGKVTFNNPRVPSVSAPRQAPALPPRQRAGFTGGEVGGAIAGIGIASETINAIKQYQALEQKISITVDTIEEQKALLQQIFKIAEKTKQPVNTVGTLYTRIASNAKAAGRTNTEILLLIENLSNLGRLSGSTAKELEAAFFQFSQGLGSVLRGEELNSVLEQAPVIVDAIARQIEKEERAKGNNIKLDRSSVRDFSEKNNGIKSDLIFRAVGTKKLQKDIEELTSKLNIRIEESVTLLRNSFIKTFGELGSNSGVFNSLAEGIELLSQNLEPVIKIGTVIAAIYGVRVAGALTRNLFLAKGLRSALLPVAGAALLMSENIEIAGTEGVTAFDLIERTGKNAFKNVLESVNDVSNAIRGLDKNDLNFDSLFTNFIIGLNGIQDKIEFGITQSIAEDLIQAQYLKDVVNFGEQKAQERKFDSLAILSAKNPKNANLIELAKTVNDLNTKKQEQKAAEIGLGITTSSTAASERQYYATVAKRESGFNPNIVNKNTGASGLYQFMDETAKSVGITRAETKDPVKALKAAMELGNRERYNVEKALGRQLTNPERYLVHQQGQAGAKRLLMNPNLNAVDALTPAYRGNRKTATQAVTGNGGNVGMTAAEFANVIKKMYTDSLTNEFPAKLDVLNQQFKTSKGFLQYDGPANAVPYNEFIAKQKGSPFEDAKRGLQQENAAALRTGANREGFELVNRVNEELQKDDPKAKLTPAEVGELYDLTAQKAAIQTQRDLTEARRENTKAVNDNIAGITEEGKLLAFTGTEREVQSAFLDQEKRQREALTQAYANDPSVTEQDIAMQAKLTDAQKQQLRVAIETTEALKKQAAVKDALSEREDRFKQDLNDLIAEREALDQTSEQREISNAILAIEQQTRSELRELYKDDAKIGEAEIERLARLTDAQKERLAVEFALTDAKRKQKALLEELRSPQDKLNERKATFQGLASEGKLTGQELEKGTRENDLAQRQINIDNGTGTFEDGFALSLDNSQARIESFASAAGGVFGGLFDTIGTGFADTMGEAIFSTESLTESFKAVARDGISQLVSGLIQLGVQYVAQEALAATLGTAATAQATAQGATIAAAYAPAAAASSAATFGTSAVAGLAALSAIAVAAGTLFAGSFAQGGLISGKGSGTSDSMIARVSNGEYIMRASAVNKNRGALEYMNKGGSVGDLAKAVPARGGNNVNITVNTPDANSFNKSKSQIARDTAMAINRANRRR